MSSEKITLVVEIRKELGKKVHALRKTGQVPAVIYEKGKESIHIMAGMSAMSTAYKNAGKHHVIELDVAGKKQGVLIQRVDLDPIKNTLMHVSFHAINQKEKVHAEIEVKLDGQAPAEKIGMVIVRPNTTVEVECLPGDLPDVLMVDPSSLNGDEDNLTVADIVAPKGVTIVTDGDRIIASVYVPRAEVEATQTEEVAAAEVPSAHGDDAKSDSEK